jgi:hypothetical protein
MKQMRTRWRGNAQAGVQVLEGEEVMPNTGMKVKLQNNETDGLLTFYFGRYALYESYHRYQRYGEVGDRVSKRKRDVGTVCRSGCGL